MAEQDFFITIRTTADTAGIKKTEADLKQLGIQVESIKPAADSAAQGVSNVGNIFGAVIGRVAAGFGAGALFENVQKTTEEIKKITVELDKQADQLVENAQKYGELAKAATTEGDVLKLASSALSDVEATHKGIISAQEQELSLYQKITDEIYHVLTPGFAKDAEAGRISEKALQLRKEAAESIAKMADQSARGAIRTGQAFTEAFEQLKAKPIDEAVAEVSTRIDKAREKQQGLNEASGSYVKDWIDAQREIENATRLIEKLLQAERQRKREAQETAESKEADVEFWQKFPLPVPPGVQPIPGGRTAGIGESQEIVNQLEKNRLDFEEMVRAMNELRDQWK